VSTLCQQITPRWPSGASICDPSILATAKTLNPNIKVFQAKRDAKGVIAFDAV
jgi:hypothetical protein